jgi:hypothetical protein
MRRRWQRSSSTAPLNSLGRIGFGGRAIGMDAEKVSRAGSSRPPSSGWPAPARSLPARTRSRRPHRIPALSAGPAVHPGQRRRATSGTPYVLFAFTQVDGTAGQFQRLPPQRVALWSPRGDRSLRPFWPDAQQLAILGCTGEPAISLSYGGDHRWAWHMDSTSTPVRCTAHAPSTSRHRPRHRPCPRPLWLGSRRPTGITRATQASGRGGRAKGLPPLCDQW